MKKRYAYSHELNAPNTRGADFDLAELALSGKMEAAIKYMGVPKKKYRSKLARMENKNFETSDGAMISYYEYAPFQEKEGYPAMIYYHGGGFMFPIQKMMVENGCYFAKHCDMKVFMPDYRIAPKADCNRIMDDCYEMLLYVYEHADELKVDKEKIILYGESAGGCLAACTALRNRDGKAIPLRGQMLIYPVCDNEYENYVSMDQYEYAAWSKKQNISMWKLYFHNGVKDIEYIVPMKNTGENLPYTYIEPQEMDVLRDEAIAYATKLQKAGVKVECNLISGSYHGFDSDRKSPLVQRVYEHRYRIIKKIVDNG